MAFSPRAHRRRTRAAGALLGGGASTSSSETANSSAGRLGLTRLLAALGLTVTAAISLLMWGTDGGSVITTGMGLLIFLSAGAAVTGARLESVWSRLPQHRLALFGVAITSLAICGGVTTTASRPTTSDVGSRLWPNVGLGILVSVLGTVGPPQRLQAGQQV